MQIMMEFFHVGVIEKLPEWGLLKSRFIADNFPIKMQSFFQFCNAKLKDFVKKGSNQPENRNKL